MTIEIEDIYNKLIGYTIVGFEMEDGFPVYTVEKSTNRARIQLKLFVTSMELWRNGTWRREEGGGGWLDFPLPDTDETDHDTPQILRRRVNGNPRSNWVHD
jgi:hypothetical protein